MDPAPAPAPSPAPAPPNLPVRVYEFCTFPVDVIGGTVIFVKTTSAPGRYGGYCTLVRARHYAEIALCVRTFPGTDGEGCFLDCTDEWDGALCITPEANGFLFAQPCPCWCEAGVNLAV